MYNVIHVDFRIPQPAPTPVDEWPADSGTVHIVTRTEPDQFGCQDFSLHWLDSDLVKRVEPCLRKPLDVVREIIIARGLDVEVIDRSGADLRARA